MRQLVEQLEQTSTWRAHDGLVFYVGELTDEQLGSILAYLGRHADELLQARRDVEEFEEPPRSVDHVHGLATVDAHEWLQERPLYRRLLTEQRRRAVARRSFDEAMIKIDRDALRRPDEL